MSYDQNCQTCTKASSGAVVLMYIAFLKSSLTKILT